MNIDRFNELLNGPLMHPLPFFTITRLARALAIVVERTGPIGEQALEQFCLEQDREDRIKAGEDLDDLDLGDSIDPRKPRCNGGADDD